jgi:hypothetical protein
MPPPQELESHGVPWQWGVESIFLFAMSFSFGALLATSTPSDRRPRSPDVRAYRTTAKSQESSLPPTHHLLLRVTGTWIDPCPAVLPRFLVPRLLEALENSAPRDFIRLCLIRTLHYEQHPARFITDHQ